VTQSLTMRLYDAPSRVRVLCALASMAALFYAAAPRAQVPPGGVPAIPPAITFGGASPEI